MKLKELTFCSLFYGCLLLLYEQLWTILIHNLISSVKVEVLEFGLMVSADLRLKRIYHCRITDVGEGYDLRIIIHKSIGG
jgi:hypothetical protein